MSGFARGWSGRGRGLRNCYWATGLPGWARAGYTHPFLGTMAYPYSPDITEKEEIDILREQAEFFKQQLDSIESRIRKMEKTRIKESE
jgi:hypothetical protein